MQRIALLLGNGKYALALHQRLRNVADLSIALFPGPESAIVSADHRVDILAPSIVLNLLRDQQITHVIFGGNFRFLQLFKSHDAKDLLQATTDPELYSALFALVRGGASRLVRHFCDLLAKHGLQPIIASDLLADLRPGAGILASSGLFAGRDPAQLELIARQPILATLSALDHQPWLHVRQAFLFDGAEFVARDAGGTDAMLEAAVKIPKKNDKPRILVKLCPRALDHRFDPPVVGPKTFELAGAAKVDLMVLDAEKGILFERGYVDQICARFGITMLGTREVVATLAARPDDVLNSQS